VIISWLRKRFKKSKIISDESLRKSTLRAINQGQMQVAGAIVPQLTMTNMYIKETKNAQCRRVRSWKREGTKPTVKALMTMFDDNLCEEYRKVGVTRDMLEALVRKAMKQEKV